MTWFSASIIMAFRFKKIVDDIFTVHENVLAIEAKDSDDAFEKANAIGQEMAISDYSLEEGPAELMFVGVRKIVEVTGTNDDPNPKPLEIKTGAEITYNIYRLPTWEDVEKLADGEEVELVYED